MDDDKLALLLDLEDSALHSPWGWTVEKGCHVF